MERALRLAFTLDDDRRADAPLDRAPAKYLARGALVLVWPPPKMETPILSNPRRYIEDGED